MQRNGKRLINFDGHTVVIGKTRSGKTWATKESIRGLSCGALFFNTQQESMPHDFVKATGNDRMVTIKNAVKRGYKINFVPSTDLLEQAAQLECIIQCLYDNVKKDVVLVVDEVHLFCDRDIKRQLIRVATTGLRWGIRGVWISQRPAEIHNTLMTQANKFVIFQTNMESNYFKRYEMPHDEIRSRIKSGGEYSYIEYDWSEIGGPYKV